MQVLVSGASGFTGQYMVQKLRESGHTPLILQSSLSDVNQLKSEILELSLDAVIHLAAISNVTHSDVASIYDVNVVGTRNLLAALLPKAESIKSVLLASTGHVYGMPKYNTAFKSYSEMDPVDPPNDYAVSKYAMELVAQFFADKLPIIITRPFNYTGRNQTENFIIPKIVGHFKRRENIIELGNTNVWREFGDVRNVVAIYQTLIENNVPSDHSKIPVFNICTGQTYRLDDVINMCSELTQHQICVEKNIEFVRENDPEKLSGNASKLNAQIGEIELYNFRQTLDWMLKSE